MKQSRCESEFKAGNVTRRCHGFSGHDGMHFHFEDGNEEPWFWKQVKNKKPAQDSPKKP